MFGPLGFWEIAFILVLALLIVGPKRLPEFGRTIGRGLGEFRRASNDLKRTINTEIELAETDDQTPRSRRPSLGDEEETSAPPSRVVKPAPGAVAVGSEAEAGETDAAASSTAGPSDPESQTESASVSSD